MDYGLDLSQQIKNDLTNSNFDIDRYKERVISFLNREPRRPDYIYDRKNYEEAIRDYEYDKRVREYGRTMLVDDIINPIVKRVHKKIDMEYKVPIERQPIDKSIKTDFANIDLKKKTEKPSIEKPALEKKTFEKVSIDINDYITQHKNDIIKFGQVYGDVNEFKNKIVGYGERYKVTKNKNGDKIFNFKLNGIIDTIKKEGNNFVMELLIGTGGKIELKKSLTDTDNYYWIRMNTFNINKVIITPYLFRYLRTI